MLNECSLLKNLGVRGGKGILKHVVLLGGRLKELLTSPWTDSMAQACVVAEALSIGQKKFHASVLCDP